MLEIAQDLEKMAVSFKPTVLIGLGLAAVLLGLFVWLGGLGFRKALVAIVGVASGGICGLFIPCRNIGPAIFLAGFAAVIAIVFEKIFITILAAVLAAILCFAVLARPYIESADTSTPYSEHETQHMRMEVALNTSQTVKVIKTHIVDFITELKRILLQMPYHNRAIIAVLALTFILAGFRLWRFTSAFCCATLGTMLVFSGMILLLLYKGAAPISRIYQNQPLYLGAFAAMTIFGTAEQLLLCKRVKKNQIRKKGKNKDRKEPEKIPMDWRNR